MMEIASTKATPTSTPERDQKSSLVRKLFSFPALLGVLLATGTCFGRYLDFENASIHSFGVSTLGAASTIPFEGDTWWQVLVGNHILSTWRWPVADSFSFTAHGAPWIAYEWLGEVAMALASHVGGVSGLVVLLVVMSSIIVLLLYWRANLGSENPTSAFLACVALVPLISISLSLRPQILAYPLLILTLIVLAKFRRGHTKALWILPPLFLLWANIHGSFVLGFVAMGCYWLGGLTEFQVWGVRASRWTSRQRIQLELTFLLCLLAVMVTPYGTKIASYPLEMVLFQATNLRTNGEFLPIGLLSVKGMLFYGLVVFFVLRQLQTRRLLPIEEVALLLFATFETAAHARFVFLFVPVFVPFLAATINSWLPANKHYPQHTVANAALICAAIVLLVKFFPSGETIDRAISYNFPVRAVEYLEGHSIPGPMFNELAWGGYLTWSLTPKHKVFIDGREDIYDYAGVLTDYLQIIHADSNTFFLLRKYQVDSCLVVRKSKLASMLAASPQWKETYHDWMSAIFVRSSPSPRKSHQDISFNGTKSSRHALPSLASRNRLP